jgi:hypothetical protein
MEPQQKNRNSLNRLGYYIARREKVNPHVPDGMCPLPPAARKIHGIWMDSEVQGQSSRVQQSWPGCPLTFNRVGPRWFASHRPGIIVERSFQIIIWERKSPHFGAQDIQADQQVSSKKKCERRERFVWVVVFASVGRRGLCEHILILVGVGKNAFPA